MLNLFLIIAAIIIWPSIYYIYLRQPIREWLINTFTRDKLPEDGDIAKEAVLPFRYDRVTSGESDED